VQDGTAWSAAYPFNLGAAIVFERGVRLVVVSACERGLLARVAASGRIAEGEQVRIESPGASGFWTNGR